MEIKEFFSTLADRVTGTANIRTVYGEPIKVDERTIIPVARASYGFGGGGGAEKKLKEEGVEEEGAGGGGGASINPIGVVEITREQTRFISFGQGKKLLGAAAAGVFLGLLLARRHRKNSMKREQR